MQSELDYYYHDFMGCPGFFDNADQEELINEYMGNFDHHHRFSRTYSNKGLLNHFKEMLELTYSYLNEESIKILIDKGYILRHEDEIVVSDNPNQLYIEFN